MSAATLPAGYALESGVWGDPELAAVLARSGAEVLALYAADDLSKQREEPLTDADVLDVVVIRDGPRIVAAGALTHRYGGFEVKRLAVAPEHRRAGLARAVLAELEERASGRGAARLRLQTGFRQLAAIALYERAGWRRIEPYGPYAEDDVVSVCFEKEL